jgi:hypothetical protein
MEDPNALLDKFTRLLAYVGDEGAKDGYFLRSNNTGKPVYSINIRAEPIPEESLIKLVKKIKSLLKNNKPVLGFPGDVIGKAAELKTLYDSTANASAKKELIDYMGDFSGNSDGMHGGASKTKRNSKGRKNRKTCSRK